MAIPFVIVGYGSLVGLSLGLTGAGGSILAIPILVYGLGLPASQAIAISLLMVSSIALFGAMRQTMAGNVDWKSAILFSLAGMVVSPLVIHLASGVNEALRLFLFALLMLFFAYRMAFKSAVGGAAPVYAGLEKRSTAQKGASTAAGGAVAGVLSGFFGVGGGFVIVPLLTMIFNMPYRRAVGTSLAAIFLISTTAIAGAISNDANIDWILFLKFVAGGMAGMLISSSMINFIPERSARRIFAAVTAIIAVFMLIDKLFIHQGGLL